MEMSPAVANRNRRTESVGENGSPFKRAGVGDIPSDWETELIGRLANIKTGSKNTQDRVADGAYPFFVRSQEIERINSYSFDGEAVLTAGDGVGTGKVFHYINGRFDVHQRVYRISDFSERLDGSYFYYQFSNRFYGRIASMTAKTSVDSVRMDMIAEMAIPLPPVSEQRQIARALSDIDALIETMDKLIDKKRALKQGAMQQLLTGRTRLPGFDGRSENVPLGRVAEIRRGDLITEKQVRPGEVPVIAGGKTPAYFHDTPNRQRNTITVSASGAYAGYVSFHRRPIFASDCSTISNSEKFAVEFLFQQLLLKQSAIYMMQTGGAQPHVHPVDLAPLEVWLPETKEQHAIAAVLSDMDAEIDALEQRREKMRGIKRGMMQELLSGRARLTREVAA